MNSMQNEHLAKSNENLNRLSIVNLSLSIANRGFFQVVMASLGLLMTLFAVAGGGELSFTASVDRTKVGLDDQLTLTVTVAGSDVGDMSEPDLPPLDKFDVIGTNSSTSSQFTIVNGKMSSSKTIDYIYYLQPREVGRWTIGSAELRLDGKAYRTEPIVVDVVAGSTGSGQRAPRRSEHQQIPEETTAEGNLFLKAQYDKTEVYVGQPVAVTYTLYSRAALTNVQYGQIPSYPGFWVEEIYTAERLNFDSRIIEGKRYDVAVIRKIALFPTTSGTLNIDPLELVCDVQMRSRDSFLDFWGRPKKLRLKSEPAEIVVRLLPQEGQPAGFSGAVGTFDIKAMVDNRQVKAGEPINLEVTIEGTGNVRTISEPSLPEWEGLKRYEPEIKENISTGGGAISGNKSYRYVLIPQLQGTYTIGPLEFPYFDPGRRDYSVATSEPITILVLPGEELATRLGTREGIKVMGKDIRYIKPDATSLSNQGARLYRSRPFQVVQVFPLVVIALSIVYRRHRDRVSQDLRYARLRRAHRLAKSRLKEASRLMKKESSAEFYAAICKALSGYLGDKLNVASTGLTIEQIAHVLVESGVEESVIGKIIGCFQTCDFARFAPSVASEEEMEKTLNAAKEAIVLLEKRSNQIVTGA